MVIYCSGPMRGNTEFQNYYQEIIEHLTSLGHTALSELNPEFKSAYPLTDPQIYKRNLKWIEKSETIIADISSPCLDVGFEIAYGLFNRKIPVLILLNRETEYNSRLVLGCNSTILSISRYSDLNELKKNIEYFLDKLE